ncbi:hypothetical protein RF679_17410 [Undibacterium cyanobacteriorum]|uniref:Uncharacterized protein n=1 Tax=Undibacterium cyanobacteriorum TaxID=3073561 RepID=A0ABY9RGN8_9BURK|nr:hypothetical protein [Undibacterium sp. 20NA77.5]WMW80403.1 hypothetical protein RF679_17410 [Undibacterium sp. 20NA77.5]
MKDFELQIIKELLEMLGLADVVRGGEVSLFEVEYSGAGYFLSFRHPALPKKRVVLNSPNISGRLGEIEVGFIGFIENSEITLECFAYEGSISQSDRNGEFTRTFI